MALYQGEDIVLSFSGEGVTDFTKVTNIIAHMYIKKNPTTSAKTFTKDDFEKSEDGDTYILRIPPITTSTMLGTYTLELKIQDDSDTPATTIFVKEEAFTVESCKIKDIEFK
jgi:hypothetical protein